MASRYGTVHKLMDLPFEITGNLSATPDGKIRIHSTSIKSAGLPVKGFMHLFGVEIIKAREARGLKMDDNDRILDPERMGLPPMIRGKVTAVQVVGDEVLLIFGGSKILSGAEITRGRARYGEHARRAVSAIPATGIDADTSVEREVRPLCWSTE